MRLGQSGQEDGLGALTMAVSVEWKSMKGAVILGAEWIAFAMNMGGEGRGSGGKNKR